MGVESGGVQTRHFGFGFQFDLRDGEFFSGFVQRDAGAGMNARGRRSGLRELGRQRHRIASGVRGPDQFLRVRSRPVRRARAPVVWAFIRAASQFHFAFAFNQIAFHSASAVRTGMRVLLHCVVCGYD